MRPPQFPTYGLMTIIVVWALWLVSVRYPSDLLTSVSFSATVGMLSLSALFAVAWRGGKGYFWKGFLIAGAIYFVIAFFPTIRAGNAPYFFPEVLLNDVALFVLSGKLPYLEEMSTRSINNRYHFVVNSHLLLTLVLALGGGFLTRRLVEQAEPPPPP